MTPARSGRELKSKRKSEIEDSVSRTERKSERRRKSARLVGVAETSREHT